MRAHFFHADDIRCVFFPDSLRYFQINKFTETILRDILDGIECNEICRRHRIVEEEFSVILKMLPKDQISISHAPSDDTVLQRLVLNISNTCNLSCIYCYANGGNYRAKPGYMPLKVLNAALSSFFSHFDKISVIQLFGGEPLLNYEGIETVGRYISQLEPDKRSKLTAVTNGTIMSKRILDIINRYDIELTVSIDGPKEINDILRIDKKGNGVTSQIEKNIKDLRNASSSVNIEATYTRIHEQMGIGIDQVGKYCKEMFNVKEMHIVPVTDSSLYIENIDMVLHTINVISDYPITMVKRILYALKAKKAESYICNAGSGTLAVSADGHVYPCFMFTDYNDYDMGSVFDPFLFKGEAYRFLIKKIKAINKITFSPCKDCFANTLCSGCIGTNMFETGSIQHASDKHCKWQRSLIEHILIELIRLNLN